MKILPHVWTGVFAERRHALIWIVGGMAFTSLAVNITLSADKPESNNDEHNAQSHHTLADCG